jgi:hypothetical protein
MLMYNAAATGPCSTGISDATAGAGSFQERLCPKISWMPTGACWRKQRPSRKRLGMYQGDPGGRIIRRTGA